ncbi:hypothetical protein METBIDRAFT_32590 [Metschnikowia bicuspidata var. bicuspidata NRRL YB-4993]|uniref:Uncharacterized protein n=1 Tax=Metschnikowia bicuspidata var. bicuspidata NRRL YB-4993 TaxID=869754 RepID=A0A1A0H9Q1_9ASCO|nr:hypothetical protein METBIDRAFT_32590 [Metschnikowia bicuspidata var. bicuspidata NRRL YB-4993]OBA20612.1 hypothetical protein METBIDRAFT_32590 [Metschnikowia bicuspidata var. bicuspidata NRRL YB-4993]
MASFFWGFLVCFGVFWCVLVWWYFGAGWGCFALVSGVLVSWCWCLVVVFWLLVFGVLVFGVLVFGVLVFGVLVFGVLVFGVLVFGVLAFDGIVFDGGDVLLSLFEKNARYGEARLMIRAPTRKAEFAYRSGASGRWTRDVGV